MKKHCTWILSFFCCILMTGCTDFLKTVTSPEGTHTLRIEYDFVSRPTVYEEKTGFDKLLWKYSGAGFMETVFVHVEWITENEALLTFDGETITIDLSE